MLKKNRRVVAAIALLFCICAQASNVVSDSITNPPTYFATTTANYFATNLENYSVVNLVDNLETKTENDSIKNTSSSSQSTAVKQYAGKHATFVKSVIDNAGKTNQQILNERGKLLALQSEYNRSHTLSASDTAWLNNLADEYKVASPQLSSPVTWKELDKRVDIVPVSLVLAQAIQESGWGNSSVARKGNNYFGQECFSRGCGITGAHHYRGSYYEMAKYDDISEAITTYIHNLNSNRAYRLMREIRYNERTHHKSVNSIELVNGLTAYSQLGSHYIAAIKNVVTHLNLQKFD